MQLGVEEGGGAVLCHINYTRGGLRPINIQNYLVFDNVLNTYKICPEMHANEIHELYDGHHKVSPNLNSH